MGCGPRIGYRILEDDSGKKSHPRPCPRMGGGLAMGLTLALICYALALAVGVGYGLIKEGGKV